MKVPATPRRRCHEDTRVQLAAPLAFVLSVSGAVLLAGCDPDAPAPVTPTPGGDGISRAGLRGNGQRQWESAGCHECRPDEHANPRSRESGRGARRHASACGYRLGAAADRQPRRRHRCPGIGERLGATVGEWNRGRRFPARGRLHVGFSTAKGFRRFIGTRRALHLAGRRPHQARVAAERPRLAADLGEHGRRRHCQGGPYGKHCRAAAEA